MFQPNSIRSLLSKRKSNRAQTAKQQDNTKDSSSIQTGLDSDYESIIQVKMLAKQIEHQIQGIRQWRQHQKQLMETKMKSNAELAHELNSVHIKNLQKQAEREQKQLKKILQQLNHATEIKIKQNDQLYDSERIFNVLNETDILRQKLKNSSIVPVQQQNYQNLVSEMDQLNQIFKKDIAPQQIKNTQPHKINSQLLKKQMDQIQDQLRQIQQLLADEGPKQNTTKRETKNNKIKNDFCV